MSLAIRNRAERPYRQAMRRHAAHVAVKAAWLVAIGADLCSYGWLVLRTEARPVGAPGLTSSEEISASACTRGSAHGVQPLMLGAWRRARSVAEQLAKGLRRMGMGWRLIRGVVRVNRDLAEACERRVDKLIDAGESELIVYGGGVPAWACELRARTRGLSVRYRGEDPRSIGRIAARFRAAPVLVAVEHGVEIQLRELDEVGIARDRIRWLDPSGLERESRVSGPHRAESTPEVSISVVVPTRGRPGLARELMNDLYRNAIDPDEVEVLLLVDEDDTPSHSLDHAKLRVRRWIGPRRGMGALTCFAGAVAAGRVLLLLNDDIRMRTYGWDRRISVAVSQFSDGVALVYGNDLHQGRRSATFPAISREALDCIGLPANPRVNHFHIESHLMSIFLRLRRKGCDRLVFLEDLVMGHFLAAGGRNDSQDVRAAERALEDRVLYATLRRERARCTKRIARRLSPTAS